MISPEDEIQVMEYERKLHLLVGEAGRLGLTECGNAWWSTTRQAALHERLLLPIVVGDWCAECLAEFGARYVESLAGREVRQ